MLISPDLISLSAPKILLSILVALLAIDSNLRPLPAQETNLEELPSRPPLPSRPNFCPNYLLPPPLSGPYLPPLSFRLRHEMAVAYGAAGLFEQALEQVETIENSYQKVDALIEIAGAASQNGEIEMASKLLSQALQEAQTLENPEGFLRKIAITLVEVDRIPDAIRIASSLARGQSGDRTLTQIAIRLAEKGQTSQAVTLSQTLPDEFSQLNAFTAIAQRYIQDRQFDRAVNVARSADDPCVRARVSANTATRLIEAQQYDLALQTAQRIEVSQLREEALQQIAVKLAEAGQFDRALNIAEAINQGYRKARTLMAIATYLAEAGQQDRAATLLDRTREMVESLERPFSIPLSPQPRRSQPIIPLTPPSIERR